jgi:hypothetical protein
MEAPQQCFLRCLKLGLGCMMHYDNSIFYALSSAYLLEITCTSLRSSCTVVFRRIDKHLLLNCSSHHQTEVSHNKPSTCIFQVGAWCTYPSAGDEKYDVLSEEQSRVLHAILNAIFLDETSLPTWTVENWCLI